LTRPAPATAELADPQALRDWILAQLPADIDITALGLFCSADLPDRILCLVSTRGAAAREVAIALGGQSFAFESVVVSLPIGQRFACRSRAPDRTMVVDSCSCAPGDAPVAGFFEKFD